MYLSSSKCPHGFGSSIQEAEVTLPVFLLVTSPSLLGDHHTLGRVAQLLPSPGHSRARRAVLATVGLAVLVYQIKPPLTSTSLLFSLFLHMELPIAGHLLGGDYGNLVEGHIGRAAGGQSLTGSLISSLTLRSPPAQFISWLCQAQF